MSMPLIKSRSGYIYKRTQIFAPSLRTGHIGRGKIEATAAIAIGVSLRPLTRPWCSRTDIRCVQKTTSIADGRKRLLAGVRPRAATYADYTLSMSIGIKGDKSSAWVRVSTPRRFLDVACVYKYTLSLDGWASCNDIIKNVER